MFARKVDLAAFAQQRAEIAHDSILRLGEWLSPNPYATNRMEKLRMFHHTALYDYWEERLVMRPVEPPTEPRSDQVTKNDCASFGRRLAAIAIDYTLVAAIGNLVVTSTGVHIPGAHFSINVDTAPVLGFLLYNIVLVSIAGQTFGMMIVSVRVTNVHFGRPGLLQVIWRYLIAMPLFVLSALWPGFWRVEAARSRVGHAAGRIGTSYSNPRCLMVRYRSISAVVTSRAGTSMTCTPRRPRMAAAARRSSRSSSATAAA